MKMNVLAAVLSSAGMAASALGQTGNGTFVIEVRLVVDGDPNAPIGAGITSYAPSSSATRVGLSLQARVTQTVSGTNVGSGNYGIGVVSSRAAASGGAPRITHNDSALSGGPYLALRRGQTGTTLGADGLPEAGVFGGENNPADMAGGTARRNFRTNGTATFGQADVNSLTGNALNANGANSASANGFFSNSANGIVGLTGAVQLRVPTEPVRYAVGVASPWYNLYRVYFDPAPGTEQIGRDVTVSFAGRVSAVYGTGDSLGLRALLVGGPGGAQIDLSDLSATFSIGTVPSPTASVALSLGGLLAARRRRHA